VLTLLVLNVDSNLNCLHLLTPLRTVQGHPVASLGSVSPGAATDGVTLFFLEKI